MRSFFGFGGQSSPASSGPTPTLPVVTPTPSSATTTVADPSPLSSSFQDKIDQSKPCTKVSTFSSPLDADKLDAPTPNFSLNSPSLPTSSEPAKSVVPSIVSATADSIRASPLISSQTYDFDLTESQNRIDEFSKYESDCTMINDFVFLGGSKVAQSAEILRANGIVRVLNCAGTVVKNLFVEGNPSGLVLKYQTFNMMDSKNEDISWFVCQTIKFLHESIVKNERVLIHCEKGISRSASLLIAFLIWEQKMSWKACLNFVQARRPISSPNSGFISNLIELDSLFLGQDANTTLFFRLAFHNEQNLNTPLMKLCRNKFNRSILPVNRQYALLNPYACLLIRFVIEGAHMVYLWKGKNVHKDSLRTTLSMAYTMKEIFVFSTRISVENQGEETEEFLNLIELSAAQSAEKENYSAEQLKDLYTFSDHYDLKHSPSGTIVDVPTDPSSVGGISRSDSLNGMQASSSKEKLSSETRNSKDFNFFGTLKKMFSNSRMDSSNEFTELKEEETIPPPISSRSNSLSFKPILSRANSYREESSPTSPTLSNMPASYSSGIVADTPLSSSPPSPNSPIPADPAPSASQSKVPVISLPLIVEVSKTDDSRRFSVLSDGSETSSLNSCNTKTTTEASTSSLESVLSKSNLSAYPSASSSKEIITPTSSPVKQSSVLPLDLDNTRTPSGIGALDLDKADCVVPATDFSLPTSDLMHLLGTPPKMVKTDQAMNPNSPPKDDVNVLRRQISQTRYNLMSSSPSGSNLLSSSPSQNTSPTPPSHAPRPSSSRKINLVPSTSNSSLLASPSATRLEPTPPTASRPSSSRPGSSRASTRPSSANSSPVAPLNLTTLSPSSSMQKIASIPALALPLTSTPAPIGISMPSFSLPLNKEEAIRGSEHVSSNSFLPKLNMSSMSPSPSSSGLPPLLKVNPAPPYGGLVNNSSSSGLLTKPTLFSFDMFSKRFVSLGMYDNQDLNDEDFFLLLTPTLSFFWYCDAYVENYSSVLPQNLTDASLASWCKLSTNYSSLTSVSKIQIEKSGEESDAFLDAFNEGL